MYYYATYGAGGNAGGYIGNNGSLSYNGHSYSVYPTGGSQTKGGKSGYSYTLNSPAAENGAFGQGGNFNGSNCNEGAGGGGGYYGGGAAQFYSGAGGSGFIGNDRITNGVMYGYNITGTINNWISNYLVEKEHFLQVGDKTFNSLNLAQAEIEENGTGTIILLKDAELNEASIIDANKNVTFDLNGHTLINTSHVRNNGNLTVIDSSLDKTGFYYSMIVDAFLNYGNITMDGINIKSARCTVYAPVIQMSFKRSLLERKEPKYGISR